MANNGYSSMKTRRFPQKRKMKFTGIKQVLAFSTLGPPSSHTLRPRDLGFWISVEGNIPFNPIVYVFFTNNISFFITFGW
jgi:hypothetical protein